MFRFIFALYQWLVAFPILLIATILTAIFTVLFSPWKNTKLGYFPGRAWARIFCAVLFVRVRVSGLENISPKQSYVFVCNHQSIFDVFAVYGWLPVFFKWMMKSDLRRIPLVGWACEKTGHIFVNRSNPKAAKRSLEAAEKSLQNGVSVVIFPEGTRTYDGTVGVFKRGAFFLATDLSLPVIPITLCGCLERLKRGSLHVTPGLIEMRIHPPVDVTPYCPDRQRELAESVRQIVIKGQQK